MLGLANVRPGETLLSFSAEATGLSWFAAEAWFVAGLSKGRRDGRGIPDLLRSGDGSAGDSMTAQAAV